MIDLDQEPDVETEDSDGVERVEVFRLGGNIYTMPAQPRVNEALKYLRLVREHGEEHAASMLLEVMLGEEAYQALLSYDGLKPEHLQTIYTGVAEITLGVMESDPKALS